MVAGGDLREGLALSPEHPHLLCLLGTAHQEAGRHVEAVAALEAALAIDPPLAGAWANLGIVRFGLGEVARSRECFERSLSLEEDEAVRENLTLVLAAA